MKAQNSLALLIGLLVPNSRTHNSCSGASDARGWSVKSLKSRLGFSLGGCQRRAAFGTVDRFVIGAFGPPPDVLYEDRDRWIDVTKRHWNPDHPAQPGSSACL